MTQTKVFLIDGHALVYRAFYAIQGLTNSKGQPTNAVYGFINALRKILRDQAPSHIAVCFDVGKKTKRQEKYADYKVQRQSMPEGLIGQLPLIKEVIKAYRIPMFEMEGYEADDVIATLAHKLKENGLNVVIASDDKDMCQLVTEGVLIYSSRQDKVLGLKESEERFGINPARITDYIALCGDTSDNIPGVFGIGEVTARNLVNEFGTIENLYQNISSVKQEKLREKLLTQKEAAFFSKELAVLEKDVPLDIDLEALKVQEPDKSALIKLFTELEFRKFVQELSQETLEEQAAEIPPTEVKLLNNADAVKDFITQVKKAGGFAIVPEQAEGQARRLWLAVGGDVSVLDASKSGQLKIVIEDKMIRKSTYNFKTLRKLCDSLSLEIEGEVFDAMLAGYLLTSGQAAFDLGALAWQYLKKSAAEDQAGQVALLEELVGPMSEDLKAKDLKKLYEELEFPLSISLADMEQEGVRLDTDALSRLSLLCDQKIQESTAKIFTISGKEFNLNSPKQLGEVLFVQLKIPPVKKTKTGFSTDEEVLSRLAAKYEIAQLILDYRQIAKLKSTYIDAFPKLMNPQTNRIHACFNQTGAETGRLSSNNPNLQNIPIRTAMGREIRRAFIPLNDGDVLLSADYSQIELRILAHMAQDENMIKAFQGGEDFHAYTAGLIFDVPENKVDAHMRNSAKRVNFGIIYGISAFGLSKDLGVSSAEAQDFIDRYFLKYPGVKTFMDTCIAQAQDSGYVTTILNRRRYIPEIKSKNIGLRQFAERQAINTPVQGSAADLMKLAIINIHEDLLKKKMRSRMIITVHDELVFNVPQSELKEMAGFVREKMENAWKLTVPITVSVKAGKNWLDMEKIF
jgi:DNA polymerase I